MLGFASSTEIADFDSFATLLDNEVAEISLMSLLSLFLKLFKSLLDLETSFILEIISFASSFASSKIFLA